MFTRESRNVSDDLYEVKYLLDELLAGAPRVSHTNLIKQYHARMAALIGEEVASELIQDAYAAACATGETHHA